MAVRGVYTKAEKKVLAGFEKTAQMLSGWVKGLPKTVASEDSIKNMGLAVDCWNPLWHDENYAAKTRWGSIIAPPMYLDCVKPVPAMPEVPPAAGYLTHWYLGEDWEFFKPVRVNDSFKVWRRPPILVDVTSLDGNGPRKYKFLDHDLDIKNQRDELVNTLKLYVELTIHPKPPVPKKIKPRPDYTYTKEEMEFIKRMEDEEEIRGADIRYWEDVSVGEEPGPVILGPTTVWDQVAFCAGRQEIPFIPLREMRKRGGMMFMADPATGVTHCDIEWHFSDRQAHLRGEPHAFHFGAIGRQLMARLLTNWMGDDGFLRRFNWRHLARTTIGDTVIGRGRVTNMRVENGEHLVDLSVWLENVRGNLTEVAVATVSLRSKEAPSTRK